MWEERSDGSGYPDHHTSDMHEARRTAVHRASWS